MSAMSTQRNRMEARAVFAGAMLATTIWALVPRSLAFASGAIEMEISVVSGLPGDSVDMSVVLHTNGNEVAGIQIDVEAAPPLTIAQTEHGRPDCRRNEALDKDYTVYSFPYRAESDANLMRALVLSLTNVTAIPDGVVLFTCRVDIDPSAEPGDYELEAQRMAGSTPAGVEIAAVGSGGTVSVADPDEDNAPLSEGDGVAASTAGGCAVGSTQPSPISAILLALPLVLWGARRRVIRDRIR